MVTRYVGSPGFGSHRSAMPQLPYAVLGELLRTYVTFLQCYLFMFVSAPYIEALSANG